MNASGGLGIPMGFRREQVAVERIEIDSREDRLTRLKQFVVGTGLRTGQVLGGVNLLGSGDGGLDNVVPVPMQSGVSSKSRRNSINAPIGTMTQQDQAKHRLP